MQVKKRKAVISFADAAGLMSADGRPLSCFIIAGADGKFKPATAIITGDKIIVTAEGIMKPAAVRFVWNETAMPNLVNSAGLPAVPFRTDGPEWKHKKS